MSVAGEVDSLAVDHDGERIGIGRRKWNADQSQRHTRNAKNKIAMHLLDYAEQSGLIFRGARKGKLITATRYLTKKPVQDAFGLDVSYLEKIRTTKYAGNFASLQGAKTIWF